MDVQSTSDQIVAAAKAEIEYDRVMREAFERITRRQVFAAAREMAAKTHRHDANWVFAMSLYSLGSSFARGICIEMGIDPDAKTVSRWEGQAAGVPS